jgi:hypothetical protein
MASGNVLTDANKRHAPALDTDVNTLRGKLVINQGAEDDQILAAKSSDVAHGVTGIAETDTYFQVKKRNAANGGALIQGLNADGSVNIDAILLQGIQTAVSTLKSNAAAAAVIVDGVKKSGTGGATLGANANIVAFSDNGTVRQILDSDGDSHQDVGTAWTNFDIFDDVEVLNALAAHVTRADDPLRQNFRAWLEQPEYARVLEKYKLVSFNEDGHHFVNMSRLTMLLCGAVRQMGAALSHVTRRLDTLEYQLAPAGASGTLPR